MTSKYTEEQQEKAMELLTDNGELNILPLEEFMTAYDPFEIARMVKQSDLNLNCDYIRVNDYYMDTHEADNMFDLITDEEIEEAFKELQ